MWPVVWQFELFGKPLTIHAFGTFIVAAFLVGVVYVQRRARRELGLDKDRVFNIGFWLLVLGILAGRLLYALLKYDEFVARPGSIFYIWEGGLVVYGGLIAGLLWLAWFLPRHPELKGLLFLDVLALGTSLGIFVGRFASLLSGEAFGVLAESFPLALRFPYHPSCVAPHADPLQPATAPPLQPTQVYLILLGLLLFLVLRLYQRRRPEAGRTLALFLMIYAAGRFLIEFVRADWRSEGLETIRTWMLATGSTPRLPDPTGLYVFEDLVSWNMLLSIPVFFTGLAIWLIRRPEPTRR